MSDNIITKHFVDKKLYVHISNAAIRESSLSLTGLKLETSLAPNSTR